MKIDLTTGTWQDNPGCPINITLVSTSDVGDTVIVLREGEFRLTNAIGLYLSSNGLTHV